MSGMTYIDDLGKAESHSGMIALTLFSGGEPVKLLLTRHAAHALPRRVSACLAVMLAEGGEILPFPAKRKREASK